MILRLLLLLVDWYRTSLLQPLHWPRIIRQATPLRPGQAAGADVVVILTNSAMWILHLAAQSLEAIRAYFVSRAEERVLECLLRSEAFLGVIFEETAE